MDPSTVILDTNVFVAAGFRAGCASGRVLDAVRAGRFRHVWHDRTRAETQRVLARVPGLSWLSVADVFSDDGRYEGPLDDDAFALVPDRHDRKYAALAQATGAGIVTADHDLLGVRDRLGITIRRPNELLSRRTEAPT